MRCISIQIILYIKELLTLLIISNYLLVIYIHKFQPITFSTFQVATACDLMAELFHGHVHREDQFHWKELHFGATFVSKYIC